MQIDNNANTTIRIEKSKEDTFIGAQCMGLKKNPFENDISSITYIEKNLQDYLVCAKSDGVRYLMYLMKSGKVLFWGRNNDIFDVPQHIPPFNTEFYTEEEKYVKPPKPEGEENTGIEEKKVYTEEELQKIEELKNEEVVCILDGELIYSVNHNKKKPKTQQQYLFFDMVYYKGFLTVQYSYSNRIEMIRDFQDDCRFYSKFFTNEAKKHRERVKNGYFLNTIDIKYYLKDFYRAENLKFLINKLLYNEYKIKTLPHDNDGIIFTKNLYPYVPGKTKGILKWKPVEMNTIDFFITVNEDLEEVLGQYVSDDDFYIFELYTIYQQKIYLFDYMFVFDQDKKMEIFSKFKTFKFKNAEEVDGVIAECKYDKEECGGFKLQQVEEYAENDLTGERTVIGHKEERVYNEKFNEFYQNYLNMDEKQLHMLFALQVADDTGDLDFDINDDKETPSKGAMLEETLEDSKEARQKRNMMKMYNEFFKQFNVCVMQRFIVNNQTLNGDKKEPNVKGNWNIFRYREDKNFPNNFKTAKSIAEEIFDVSIDKDELVKMAETFVQSKTR